MKIEVSGVSHVDRIVWKDSQISSRAWPLDIPMVCKRGVHWLDKPSGAEGVAELLDYLKEKVEPPVLHPPKAVFIWRAERLSALATDLSVRKPASGKRWRLVEAIGWAGNDRPSNTVLRRETTQKEGEPSEPTLRVRFGGTPNPEPETGGSNDLVIWRPIAWTEPEGTVPQPFWEKGWQRIGAKCVVVVDSDYLRWIGRRIGKRLSLDQAIDQVSEVLASGPLLDADLNHVVVCLGPFACLYFSRNGKSDAGWSMAVYFLPRFDVDRFGAKSGWMTWFDEWMLAELARVVAKAGELTADVVRQGLDAGVRRTARLAAGLSSLDRANVSWVDLWKEDLEVSDSVGSPEVQHLQFCVGAASGEGTNWVYGASSVISHALASLENRSSGRSLNEIGDDLISYLLNVVNYGVITATGQTFPVVRFGDLVLVDRNEIDHYRGLRNLLEEYLLNPNWTKPISIAVFGPPGSGKSFGVGEIARAMPESFNLDRKQLVFNLSQFESIEELSGAFHRIQDACLDERIPIGFFDEFDSDKNGQALGWLKHFLMPMQDGEFSERGVSHKLKKCILIFAGGTSRSFEQFSAKVPNRGFVEAKGPDFLSRLRGHVNNKGISLLDGGDEISRSTNRVIRLRRAIMLRFQIKAKLGFRDLTEEPKLGVTEQFIRPFLSVPDFRHGVRSMEAIVQMCQINDLGSGLNLGSLPIPSLLDMHVDVNRFFEAIK